MHSSIYFPDVDDIEKLMNCLADNFVRLKKNTIKVSEILELILPIADLDEDFIRGNLIATLRKVFNDNSKYKIRYQTAEPRQICGIGRKQGNEVFIAL